MPNSSKKNKGQKSPTRVMQTAGKADIEQTGDSITLLKWEWFWGGGSELSLCALSKSEFNCIVECHQV